MDPRGFSLFWVFHVNILCTRFHTCFVLSISICAYLSRPLHPRTYMSQPVVAGINPNSNLASLSYNINHLFVPILCVPTVFFVHCETPIIYHHNSSVNMMSSSYLDRVAKGVSIYNHKQILTHEENQGEDLLQ